MLRGPWVHLKANWEEKLLLRNDQQRMPDYYIYFSNLITK